jgi:hypothetical protein
MGRRAVLVMPFLVASPIPAGPAFARCPKPSRTVHVLARAGASVVYNNLREKHYEGASRIYGCRGPHGRPHTINQRGEWGFNSVDNFVFAGPFVAFQEDWGSAAGDAANTVVVRDIRTGRLAVDLPVSERGSDLGDYAEVLLLKRNGSVAWLARTGPPDDIYNHDTGEVHVADRDGITLLDQDVAVEGNSLRMSPDHRSISWLHGAELRRATFR